MKSFPPLPTEFEVASLKPSAPDTGGGRGATGTRPDVKNGRLYLPRISLKNLMSTSCPRLRSPYHWRWLRRAIA
jgi:hypothetical protein